MQATAGLRTRKKAETRQAISDAALALATSRGARVVAIGGIIDRTAGRDPFDVPFRALMKLDLPSYAPGDCPSCLDGAIPAEKPGSRPEAGVERR